VAKFFLNEYTAAEKKYGKLKVSPSDLRQLLYLKFKGIIDHKTLRELFIQIVEKTSNENENVLQG